MIFYINFNKIINNLILITSKFNLYNIFLLRSNNSLYIISQMISQILQKGLFNTSRLLFLKNKFSYNSSEKVWK